jgi:hypothetical protein
MEMHAQPPPPATAYPLTDPRDQVLYKERLLGKHMLLIFIGEEDQMGVVDFLDKMEQFVELGVGFGHLKSDKRIDDSF